MAFEAYDDYEQSEQLRKWLRENGLSIVVGIVLGLLLIFGWQQWRSHRAQHRAEAAARYDALQKATDVQQAEQADALADQLMKDYADTPYAAFAAGERALRLVDKGQLDQARTALNWAEAHAGNAALKSLFTLRLAKLDLAQDKADAALARLDKLPPGGYVALAQELRGDALVKLGRDADAHAAFAAALAALPAEAPQRGLLQVKLDDTTPAGGSK